MADIHILPSYRLRRVSEQYEKEGYSVWFKKANSLDLYSVSTLNIPWSGDSIFLFFTDDIDWPRPVPGTLNAVSGAVHSAGGVLTLPFDGGTYLKRSLGGLLFSLSELIFSISVRVLFLL